MAVKHQTRDIGPLSLRASFAPGSVDVEKRTVDLVWTSGSRVLRGFFSQFYEELSLDPAHVRMGRLLNGAPFLAAHNSYSLRGVLGVVESAKLEKKRGIATVRFPTEGTDEESDRTFSMISQGILRNISVGYAVYAYERAGEVGEGDDAIPIFRAIDWEPHELSLVSIGADDEASTRSSDTTTNRCVFIDETRGITMSDKNKPPKVAVEFERTTEVVTPTVDLDKVCAEAVTAERTRSSEIRRVGKSLRLGEDFIRSHTDGTTTADAFRSLAIDERAAQDAKVQPGGRIEAVAGGDETDKFRSSASNWLLVRSGSALKIREAAKLAGKTVDVDPGNCRGMVLMDLASECLRRAGNSPVGMSRSEIAARVLGQRGAFQATTDFPIIMEEALHRTLLADYTTLPDTWRRFCATGSVSDFRAHNRYRLSSLGGLETVIEGAEFENQQIEDGSKESITALTKGMVISLTRQALINDDMGAFSRRAAAMGRAAARTIELAVYTELAKNSGLGPAMADGNPLFDAAHNNLGAGSAMTVATLDANRLVMASQQDPGANDYLDLRPTILLVPLALGTSARTLVRAEFNQDASNKSRPPNPIRDMVTDIIDTPRVSGTRRYLFADPNVAATFEVAFLDGQEQPFVEMWADPRTDGLSWKIRLDFGVGAVDYRGAVTDAGS